MASNNLLTTTTNSGSQSTASDSSLQSSVAANSVSGGTPSSIQPGTNSTVLFGTGGIPLGQTSLATVPLVGSATQTATVVQSPHHKVNPALLGFSVVLFIVAIALFWFMGRDEKSTTIK